MGWGGVKPTATPPPFHVYLPWDNELINRIVQIGLHKLAAQNNCAPNAEIVLAGICGDHNEFGNSNSISLYCFVFFIL